MGEPGIGRTVSYFACRRQFFAVSMRHTMTSSDINEVERVLQIKCYMLRIIQNVHAAGAKSYYSTADYYSEGQELEVRWRGSAAKLLGLEGAVGKPDWDALCDNLHPLTDSILQFGGRTVHIIGRNLNSDVRPSIRLVACSTKYPSVRRNRSASRSVDSRI